MKGSPLLSTESAALVVDVIACDWRELSSKPYVSFGLETFYWLLKCQGQWHASHASDQLLLGYTTDI
jgi:hypothetical protein